MSRSSVRPIVYCNEQLTRKGKRLSGKGKGREKVVREREGKGKGCQGKGREIAPGN